jgi:glycogen debranching enzyme
MPDINQQLVLKEGEIFQFSEQTGDIDGDRPGSTQGLYYRDTRFLSLLTLTANGQPPSLLTFTGYQNFMATFQFANDIWSLPGDLIARQRTLSLRRSRFIGDALHERIGVVNYNRFPVPLDITLTFGSDFRDIFDIRGYYRAADARGDLLEPVFDNGKVMLRYEGRDGVQRATEIRFNRPPTSVSVEPPAAPDTHDPTVESGLCWRVRATWDLMLDTGTPFSLAYYVMPVVEGFAPRPFLLEKPEPPPQPIGQGRFDRAVDHVRLSYTEWDAQCTAFTTDNPEFNALLSRSVQDLRLLSQREGDDAYLPSAGTPLFCCPFGRDSLITALQALSLNPAIAVGTLRVLARYQGEVEDEWREEQPGKILHEMRFGELARMGRVPHTPYYGTADATPLFVLLFAETMRWMDDNALYAELLPNVRRALEWMDKYGDVDGDGFVEYTASKSPVGLRNQVWKDSPESMQMPDGTLAETPVAGVEVQGYVYAAKHALARLLRNRGEDKWADALDAEVALLKERFNEAFWMPEEQFYAQGLDRDKRQVPTITSNPGHCLWSGIVDEERAEAVVQRLMQPDMLSGWGIRTVSDQSPSYNPMTYHNGSVWPHDNSIIVAGMKRYGFHDEANVVITQVFEAAQHFSYLRLPELYCGFARDRQYSSGPAEYPVSCSPQAWAAGASILMLQAVLGMSVDAAESRVHLRPRLPAWLQQVTISNMCIGSKRVSITLEWLNGRHVVHILGDSAVPIELEQL